MKSERGFALIAALWLIATLSVLVGGEMAVATLGQKATVNRIVLTRSRWAAEACLAIVQSRWRQRRLADGDTIDLGRDTRCNWQIEDPGSRININAADPDLLLRALADTTLVSDLLAERRSAPFRSLAQLAPEIRPVLTVDGPGTINVNAASRRVLSSLPGLTAEAATRILDRRAIGRPIGGLDEMS